MALSDPFATVYEGGLKAKSTLGEAFQLVAQQYAQQKQKEKLLQQEYKLRQQAERPSLLATLATKGFLPATNLPKEPQTIEDYQTLAQQKGLGLSADTPETAKRLLEATGIQIPKRPKTFQLGELGEFYQTGIGRNIGDVSDLTSEQQLQGRALARKLYGVRGAEYGLPAVYEEMRQGKNIDEIEDSLRYAGQSKEFTGAIRNAAQSLNVNKPETTRNSNFDALDDYLQQGNNEGAKDYLKKMAIDNSTADQQNQILGKERTVEFLGEIKNDLETLKSAGVDTNIFRGTQQEIMNKVGMVGDPRLVKTATKIALALFQYRRSMTGVQFGMKEHAEYYKVFPSIKKEHGFNVTAVDTLKNTFDGDVERFYKQKIGNKNYSEIFGERETTTQPQTGGGWTDEKEKRYQELLKKRGG